MSAINKAILDIETGGFSITKNGVVEIGALIIDQHNNPLTEHYWIIKPYTRPDSDELVSYKDDAMAIHGITMDEIEDGWEVSEALDNLKSNLNFHDVKTIIGHNLLAFDLPRIQHLFERFSQLSFEYQYEDTLLIAREKLNLPCNKLESLCENFGIEHNNKHRAIGDCYATLEVYKRLF